MKQLFTIGYKMKQLFTIGLESRKWNRIKNEIKRKRRQWQKDVK